MSAPAAPTVIVAVSALEMAANFTGVYSSETVYRPGQWAVESEGLWACVEESKGNTPAAGSAFWRLIGLLPEG